MANLRRPASNKTPAGAQVGLFALARTKDQGSIFARGKSGAEVCIAALDMASVYRRRLSKVARLMEGLGLKKRTNHENQDMPLGAGKLS
jgi:hypothetical protein